MFSKIGRRNALPVASKTIQSVEANTNLDIRSSVKVENLEPIGTKQENVKSEELGREGEK